MKQKILLIILFSLSFLALVDSSVITYLHYSPSSSSLCNFGANFDCGVVSHSVYANIDNVFYFLAVDLGLSFPIITIAIPVAVMGILVFLLIKTGILHIWHGKSIGKFSPSHMLWVIRGILIFATVYGLWLIYIQKYVLRTYCVYCLVLDLLIWLSLITSFMIKDKGR